MPLRSANDCERAPGAGVIAFHCKCSPTIGVYTLKESHFTRKSFDPARARVLFVNLPRERYYTFRLARHSTRLTDWESPRRCHQRRGQISGIITHASGCSMVSVRASRPVRTFVSNPIEMVIVHDALTHRARIKRDEMLDKFCSTSSHTRHSLCSRFVKHTSGSVTLPTNVPLPCIVDSHFHRHTPRSRSRSISCSH